MDDEVTRFRERLDELKALKPPARINKKCVNFKAQSAVYCAANAIYKEITFAALATIPPNLLLFELRVRDAGRNRAYCSLEPTLQSVNAVLVWLRRCGWQSPPATCKPTRRGRGKKVIGGRDNGQA